MRRGLVLVEGQTEEVFVERTLNPHLWEAGLHLSPTILKTRRVGNGPDHKGGISTWAQVARDTRLLLPDSDAVVVTTMIDLYGLPNDTPGLPDAPRSDALARAEHVEAAIDNSFGDERVRAHLQVHEFEALLYADPDECGRYLGDEPLATTMTRAREESGGPEFVNDSAATAPSKRILASHPTYRKTSDGPVLVHRIGLAAIRAQCPHFDGWLTYLEQL